MKKLVLLVFILLPLSCFDTLSRMYDDLAMKVPICVNSSVAASGDGRGWKNAYKTIQEAVNAAQPGDEIWVKTETLPYSITSTINISNSIAIYGGFNGTESHRSERNLLNKTSIAGSAAPLFDIQAFNVIIDGFLFNNITGNCISIDNAATPSYSVKIQNSEFNNNSAASIFINQFGSIDITGCIFDSNNVSAILATNGTITIKDSTFTNNVNRAIDSSLSSSNLIITISNSKFNNNSKLMGSGGAIYLYAGTLSISGTTFDSNSVYRNSGGAIFTGSGCNLTISSSIFNSNSTILNGGAICSQNSAEIRIYNVIFTGNKALADEVNSVHASGGAYYFDNIDKVTITGCIFGDISNPAKINSASGSGIANGGAIYVSNSSNVLITESFILKNTAADYGGGIYETTNDSISIINTCIIGNQGSNGGGIYVAGSTSNAHTLVNLTFYSNTASGNGGAIFMAVNNSVYNSVFFNNTATGTLSSYNIWFNGGGVTGNIPLYNCFFHDNGSGNGDGVDGILFTVGATCIINSSSPFLSTESGNARFLRPNSYIIDEGINSAPGLPSTDIGGFPRIANGIVDIGAYEWQ